MHNDTVRQYLTMIKRLMTYKEQKAKGAFKREDEELYVC